MPKVSKESASIVADYGVAEDRTEVVDDFSISFVTIRETHDLAPMLASLPDGRCQCTHWGYLISGQITVRYADHEEVFTAGDAFYIPPGHTPAAEAGTQFVQFSPADEMAEFQAAIKAAMPG